MPKNSSADWRPPDNLQNSSPRPVRLTAQGIVVAVIAGCLFVGSLVLGIFMARTAKRVTVNQQLLRSQGVVTNAIILRLWRSGDKSSEPRVTYRFEDANAVYTSSVKAPLARWRELKEGQTLQVRYVPAQPSVSHPVDWSDEALPVWFPYLITAFVAGLGAMLSVQIARQMRLLAEGIAVPGQMTGFRRTKRLFVVYEFQLQDGTRMSGRSAASKMPAEGEQLCILYDPANPRHNSMYPLQMVRLG